MKTIYLILLLLSLGSLYSCKTSQIYEMKKSEANSINVDSLIALKNNSEYKIRINDKISISVWGHDDLSVGSTYGIYNSNEVYGKWLMVDLNGNIELPNIGKTMIQGMTIIQLKDFIQTKLKSQLTNPIVDIKVLNREISLLGEFKNPQVVTIDKENTNLLTLVATAGGFEKFADLKKIQILRQNGNESQILTADLSKSKNYPTSNIALYPGDVVIAPSKKYKTFDQRISIVIPFTSLVTTVVLLLGLK